MMTPGLVNNERQRHSGRGERPSASGDPSNTCESTELKFVPFSLALRITSSVLNINYHLLLALDL